MKQPTLFVYNSPLFYQKMQSFKQHLAEAVSTEVSTALETVLGACYYAWHKKDENILKEYMDDTSGPFNKAKKYWASRGSKYPADWSKKGKTPEKKDLARLMQFGRKVREAVGVGGKFAGQKQGTITKEWADWSGKIKADKTPAKDVSKTDIILGTKKCSVKNADGAQLMSGKKGESIATAEAAALTSGLDPALLSKLTNGFNALEAFTTEGYYASIENLKSYIQIKKRKLKLY